ncbi:hypothetical protein BC567DRAFT_49519 [Phyllosticta citribraziliensis]
MGHSSGLSNDRISLSDLSPDHGHALKTTIARVLETEIARTTFAQILDGLPLDNGRQPRPWLHPPVDGNTTSAVKHTTHSRLFEPNFLWNCFILTPRRHKRIRTAP